MTDDEFRQLVRRLLAAPEARLACTLQGQGTRCPKPAAPPATLQQQALAGMGTLGSLLPHALVAALRAEAGR
jgi:hypothetical protein